MSANDAFPYATYLDVKFPALSVVDVSALVKACTDQWYNQTLCKVNDSVVRLGVMQGEYHWHKHDNDDEFFFVLERLLELIRQIDNLPARLCEIGFAFAQPIFNAVERMF